MKLTELGIGSEVFLEIGEGDTRVELKSRVHDFVYDGAVAFFPEGGNLEELQKLGRFSIRAKSENRMYRWVDLPVIVKKILGKDALVLKSDKDGLSGNLRDAYRVKVYKKLDLRLLGRDKVFTAVAKDISVVGIGLLLLEPIEEGTLLEIDFEDLGFKVRLKAEVVRRVQDGNLTLHGCRLIEPSQALQRYIFEKQRMEMKK